MKYIAIVISLVSVVAACAQNESSKKIDMNASENTRVDKIHKSNEEWRKELDPETFYITREKGTEPAFSGKFNKHKEEGTYLCSNCQLPLFDSEHKYESGSGWPSFYTVHEKNSVEEISDRSHGMIRVEVACNRCGAHLGHVFNDGPQPTGMRYCINSASLEFKKE